MDYISAEEFRKQSEDVQQALIKWFLDNKNTTDLVQIELYPKSELKLYSLRLQECNLDFEDSTLIKVKDRTITTRYEITPLLTEGQIRKFIEDKTECKICLEYYKTTGYEVLLSDIEHNKENAEQFNNWYEDLGTDLLQAYWKVACEIAKEGI